MTSALLFLLYLWTYCW